MAFRSPKIPLVRLGALCVSVASSSRTAFRSPRFPWFVSVPSVSRWRPSLERELHRQLDLAGIADTLPQEAVEIEQAGRDERIHVVVVVEGVEHLHHRRQREPIAEFEGPEQTPVEGEVLVVLAQMVPAAVDAIHYAAF